MRSAFLACCAFAAVTTAAGVVRAQQPIEGAALNQLDPAPAGDPFFAVPSAWAPSQPVMPRGYLMFDYAAQPLRLANGGAVVSEQAFVRADLSLAILDRLLLSVQMPVQVLQSGDGPTFGGVQLVAPQAPNAGDLRIGARVRLFGENFDPFQLAVGGYFYVPTSPAGTLAGESSFHAQPHLIMSGRVGRDLVFRWAAYGGANLRTNAAPHAVTYGAALGLGFADDRVQVGPELFGSTAIGDAAPLGTPTIDISSPVSTNLELLAGAKVRIIEGLFAGVGAGPGLTNALGTPTYRVVTQLGYAQPPERAKPKVADRDKDGVEDRDDRCPDVPGKKSANPAKNGCPVDDRDGDGIADEEDACPDKKGRANDDPTRNGCPPDFDKDGIPDAEDACPNDKGVASPDPKKHGCPGLADGDLDGIPDKEDACPREAGVPNADLAKNGCPPDRDGDRIADAVDACPDKPGKPDPDPKQNGCPPQAALNGDEIVINRQVLFKFDGRGIEQAVDPVSDDLLTEVKRVIDAHPELEKIEVQGHADNLGTPAYNQALSKARADSVRNWLIKRGVAAAKLSSKGYGDTKPVASNDTDEGRQKNRRVQFHVTKRAPPKKK